MKLHILSDLHLEFARFDPYQAAADEADVIVLAGDIANGSDGVVWARKAFPHRTIIYAVGNHEFYGGDRITTLAQIRHAGKRYGVEVLDNNEYVINEVRFLGCTLWTDFQLFGDDESDVMWAQIEGGSTLSDFKGAIHEGQERFKTSRSIELHQESLAWLTAKLDEPFDGKTVVITHHLPSGKSVVPHYKNSIVSACFASNLDHLFGKMDLWIHGHTHDCLDYVANGTRVVCNPRGYVTYNGQENFEFDPALIVEI